MYDPAVYHMKKANRKQVVAPVVAREKNAKKMERMMKKMAINAPGEPKTSRMKKLGMDSSDDDSSDDNKKDEKMPEETQMLGVTKKITKPVKHLPRSYY